ncbi:RING finger protein 207-like [Mizuhopecten yessoensis]|uniref:E3 ubiquitin-protein ligase MID2 n=1 Tax=Mizuhopecten yessoensis TaxID=6573 RepID=A0A210QM12_MIZYE|nr:RING finger protein 207-like [Mizuhopecten yessoensis]XP_021354996.1 RING finger protein 207-like [Mizuhopecten yessoensis]OWF49731.1 E3 ubiquitin-protein ligase MID2 [Mizuhopecten yessoensis]
MAEGGPHPDPHSEDSTLRNLSDSHLLECPICLEQLRQPKSLPCRHSLCEECLSSYIVSEVLGTSDTATSFICPVCRTLTHPVDKSEDKEKWAQQFPTDTVAIEIIQLRNRTTEPRYCAPCQRKGSMTSAQFWCKTNQSLFCESCKVDHHDVVHVSCDIVNISGSGNFLLRQETSDKRCDKHKKKIAYYCEDHKSLGCSKCITVGHRKCDNVSTTEDYCEKLNSSSQLEERKTFLQQGADDMESMIKDFYLRQQNIADDKDAVLKSIDDLQERMDKRIREMKKEITDDVITAYKQERENLKVSTQKCERLKVAIQNTLASSATALQRNDHMDTIRLYQKGQTELEACKDLVKEMQMSISSVSIEHEIDSDVTSLNFGKVVVRKQRRDFPGVPSLVKPLSQCEVREIRKVNIQCRSDQANVYARGVVYFPDGRIVVGDNSNNKIKLINDAGDVVDELKMDGKPWDLCLVDNTTVATAIQSTRGIHVVTVTPSKLTLSSVINDNKPYYGITYRDEEFIVSTGSEVCSVKKDGTTKTLYRYNGRVFALSHNSKDGQLFIAHYTNSTGRTVIGRLSTDNNYTDVLKVGVVKCPYGVDVDMEGNVYVCGNGSHNVVQMSGDGTNVRELLTGADGITQPLAISVCGDKLVVTNGSGQKDSIQVFQLV